MVEYAMWGITGGMFYFPGPGTFRGVTPWEPVLSVYLRVLRDFFGYMRETARFQATGFRGKQSKLGADKKEPG